MSFIAVRTYDNYVVANIQLGFLQNEGINCYIADEFTVTIDPLLSPAIGGMKLMVYTSQVERALELLDSVSG